METETLVLPQQSIKNFDDDGIGKRFSTRPRPNMSNLENKDLVLYITDLVVDNAKHASFSQEEFNELVNDEKGKKYVEMQMEFNDPENPYKPKQTTGDTYAKFYGVSPEGYSVYAYAKYQPFFWIQLPDRFSATDTETLVNYIRHGSYPRINVTSYRLVTHRQFYEFIPDPVNPTTAKQFKYLQIFFASQDDLRSCFYKLEKNESIPNLDVPPNFKWLVHEMKINGYHKVVDTYNFTMMGAIRIPKGKFTFTHQTSRTTWSQLEASFNLKDALPDDCVSIPPLVMLCYDLEAYTSRMMNPNSVFEVERRKRQFPNPTLHSDRTTMIAYVVQIYGVPSSRKWVIHTCEKVSDNPTRQFGIEGTGAETSETKNGESTQPTLIIYKHETEQDMINGFRDDVVYHTNADIITGYNIDMFDTGFLSRRSNFLFKNKNQFSRYHFQSRIISQLTPLKETESSTSAKGDKVIETLNNLTGIVSVDMYPIIKASGRFADNSLKNVCKELLHYTKIDLSPEDLFELNEGTISKDVRTNHPLFAQEYDEWKEKGLDLVALCNRREIEYNAVDCDCALDLMLHEMTLENNIQISRITSTPLHTVINNGQQIRIINMIVRDCHKKKMICNIPSWAYEGSEDPYEGAIVLEPIRGYYVDEDIATLDFNSLYPSIMRDKNLCPSTLARGNNTNLESKGIKYTKLELEGETHVFVQNVEGVVPNILKTLLDARNAVKKEMKTVPKDSVMYGLLDAKQAALKVVANSVYGFFGVKGNKASCPCRPVAMCTTAVGRQMIMETKELIERVYNAVIVYGDTDSVFVKFPQFRSSRGEMKQLFDLATEAAQKVTDHFSAKANTCFASPTDPPIIKIVLEKVYSPFLITNKKKYMGRKWENPNTPNEKIEVKGIEVVTKSMVQFAKTVIGDVTKPLMVEKSLEKVCRNIEKHFLDLINGKIPFEHFIITAQLASSYKKDPLHKVVVDQISQRCPGSEPKIGDRVPYVVVYRPNLPKYQSGLNKNLNAGLETRVESPDWAYMQGMSIDYIYYIEHRIQPLLERILNFTPIVVKDLLSHFVQVLSNRLSGTKPIFGRADVFTPYIIPPVATNIKKVNFVERPLAFKKISAEELAQREEGGGGAIKRKIPLTSTEQGTEQGSPKKKQATSSTSTPLSVVPHSASASKKRKAESVVKNDTSKQQKLSFLTAKKVTTEPNPNIVTPHILKNTFTPQIAAIEETAPLLQVLGSSSTLLKGVASAAIPLPAASTTAAPSKPNFFTKMIKK